MGCCSVESTIPFDKDVTEQPAWYGVSAVIGFLLVLVLLGVALQLTVPNLLSGAAATVGTGIWASLGRGLVLALLGPAAFAVLMMTLVGAPIGLVGLAALFLLYALAFVAITYNIGRYVRRLFGKTDLAAGAGSRILWTAGGILVLIIVGLVPFIGWAIALLAIVAGLGAVVSQLGPVFRKN